MLEMVSFTHLQDSIITYYSLFEKMYLRVNDFTHTNRMTSGESFIHSFNCQFFDRLTSYPSDVWVKIVARMNVHVFNINYLSVLPHKTITNHCMFCLVYRMCLNVEKTLVIVITHA
jgi:hypothetical protein